MNEMARGSDVGSTRRDTATSSSSDDSESAQQRARVRWTMLALAVTSPIWIGAWLLAFGLLTLVVPNVIQKYFQSASTKVGVDIASIESAAKEFAINNAGKWPDDLRVLVVPDVNGESYLDVATVPLDPWGREYLYEPPRSGRPAPRIYSLGRDGLPGGDGEDADVDNATARRGPPRRAH